MANHGSETSPEWSIFLETGILGMSADGRWIGYVVALQQGGRGTGYEFRLLDREDWAEAYYPLLSLDEQDDKQLTVTREQMTARLSAIQGISARLGLSPAIVIDTGEQYTEHASDRTTLDLDFDGLMFAFTTEGTLTRSYLHLECKRFVPARRIRVLAVNNYPKYVSDEDWIGLEDVKSFRRIHAVFVSACGKFISLMIGTNAENSCWGTVDYTFVHTTIEELRRTCLDCINR